MAAALVLLIGVGGFVLWLVLKSDSPKPGTPEGEAPSQSREQVLRKEQSTSPELFRKQGQVYAVKVLMNLHGRASHEDWGVASVLNVNYLVTLRYNETVIESGPKKLIVERHFLEARHRLVTTVEDLNLSQDMQRAWSFLDYVAVVEPRVGQVKGVVGQSAERLKVKLMEESKRLQLNWTPALEKIGQNPARSLKALSSQLEGRKVKLLWTEAGGVQVLSGASDLPRSERRLLERASLLADGALFPNKNKRHGERWKVDAKHFNDFLDIGLDGALRGQVSLRREADELVGAQNCAKLSMLGGTLQVIRDDESREQRGSLSPSGLLFYDLDNDLICKAQVSGRAKAQFASKDHLLFKMKFKGTPEFSVLYQAHLKR